MIFRVASIAQARASVVGRRFASSSVTPSPAGGPLTSFARGWYNLYVSLLSRSCTSTTTFARCDPHNIFCLLFFVGSIGLEPALPDMPLSWPLELLLPNLLRMQQLTSSGKWTTAAGLIARLTGANLTQWMMTKKMTTMMMMTSKLLPLPIRQGSQYSGLWILLLWRLLFEVILAVPLVTSISLKLELNEMK